MNYLAWITSLILLTCTAAAVADDGLRMSDLQSVPPTEIVAMGGGNFPFFINAGGPPQHPNQSPPDNSNRHAERAAPAHEHNEGFGYGFERRRERHAAPGQQGQEQGSQR